MSRSRSRAGTWRGPLPSPAPAGEAERHRRLHGAGLALSSTLPRSGYAVRLGAGTSPSGRARSPRLRPAGRRRCPPRREWFVPASQPYAPAPPPASARLGGRRSGVALLGEGGSAAPPLTSPRRPWGAPREEPPERSAVPGPGPPRQVTVRGAAGRLHPPLRPCRPCRRPLTRRLSSAPCPAAGGGAPPTAGLLSPGRGGGAGRLPAVIQHRRLSGRMRKRRRRAVGKGGGERASGVRAWGDRGASGGAGGVPSGLVLSGFAAAVRHL